MARICIGCGLATVDGSLVAHIDDADCDIKLVCSDDGLRIEHSLNRMVLRRLEAGTQFISAPGGIDPDTAYGAQVEWDGIGLGNDVVDGTGLTHVGHAIRIDKAGFYLIESNFRVRAAPVTDGVGEHMLNFNIRIDGVRRGGSIFGYDAPFSHRSTDVMTSNLAAGQIIDIEFADQPTSGMTAQDWQLENDSRNEFSVTRLIGFCPPVLV